MGAPLRAGEQLEPSLLAGVESVVHAAYDLEARGDAVRAVNYGGSMPLIEALAERGGRVVLLSSLAAFEGRARSTGRRSSSSSRRYGSAAASHCGRASSSAGAAPGSSARSSRRSRTRSLVPMIGGGYAAALRHPRRAPLRARRRGAVAGRFHSELPGLRRARGAEHACARSRSRSHPHRDGACARSRFPRSSSISGSEPPRPLACTSQFRSDRVRSLANPIPFDQVAMLARGPGLLPRARA